MRFIAALSLGLTCASATGLAAQEARAVRVNGDAPVIDGRLGDIAWRYAPPLTEFLQRDPVEGAAPSESTEVRFAYTDRDLYVAFRGFDRDPDRVYGRLVRRDQRTSADYFSLFIDSYYDQRTAFEFSINPSGARRDVLIYDDGIGRDDSWDPVFDWATRTDSLGWTVELRIPFSQLRFSQRDSLVFGVRVRRSINRRNEEVNWPFFPRDQAGEVSRYGQLVGLTDLPATRRVELLPYSAGNTILEPEEEGNPFATGQRSTFRAGADLKLGLTSGLTLDLTANPDFGQVEADAAVVNLSAFETFFPEKRPFFVEGTNLFQFGLAPGERGRFGFSRGGQEGLVYTRRIGRSPQVSPDGDQGGYAEDLVETTILSAAKVSGQIGRGWSVGLAQAVTAKELAQTVDSAGVEGRAPVEPLTSYTVVRAERALRQGRLAYGAIATATVRRLNDPAFGELHSRAYSGGMDGGGRFGGDRYEYDFAFMGSRVEGSPDAILRTQRQSARYFQRPDQTHSVLDSTRTSLSGFAGYLRFAKVTGFLTWDLRYGTRSPGFETNDLGFLRRVDLHEQRAEVEFRWLEPGQVFRRFEVRLEQQAEFTYGWERTGTSIETSVSADFLNYWSLDAGVERRFSSLSNRLLRGGPAFQEPASWDLRVGGRTDFRRPVSANFRVSTTVETVSGARRWSGGGGVRLRPPGRFSMSLEGRASWGTTDRQYVTQETVGDSTYYVLGEIDRREISLTLRADFAITPRLSLEFYAQPFVSAGRYQTLNLAADPRADLYNDRLDPLAPDRMNRPGGDESVEVDVDRDGTVDFTFSEPDFRVVSLRTNAVLRWEFLPGSTLFVVWQQDRRDRVRNGSLDLTDALSDTFQTPGMHVLAVKVAYWFGL
ncbi:MAG: hypothetical protein GTN62_10630 [Gemmatimonadales bacterium]|nr:hypothetical protein [Gemmatimonadales bacterium]NIN12019.1 hypothetical protein [Gemmatimonadales bacterium]NIN50550.1 hypothetical protein [Gemmatimonadales bacterium]NIP08014.1 hypothetical protein [Gemmatimonadales bacterium]NIR02026.1 hypothetical protein [Gemmatimonadales bacterium]